MPTASSRQPGPLTNRKKALLCIVCTHTLPRFEGANQHSTYAPWAIPHRESGRRANLAVGLRIGARWHSALKMTSTHFNPVDMNAGGYIQGLTHPPRHAAVAPRGSGGQEHGVVKTSWVERLFVLTDTALFWYELGGMLVSQHGRVEFRHIRSIRSVEQSSGAAANASEPDLANHGPMHQLEITLVTDFVLLVGGSQPEFVEAWKLAIAQSVERAALLLANLSEPPPPATRPTARLELTGISTPQKAIGFTGTLKTGLEHAGFISITTRR